MKGEAARSSSAANPSSHHEERSGTAAAGEPLIRAEGLRQASASGREQQIGFRPIQQKGFAKMIWTDLLDTIRR
jgi:hypothetical protein